MAKSLSVYKGYAAIYDSFTDFWNAKGYELLIYPYGYPYRTVATLRVGIEERRLQERFQYFVDNNLDLDKKRFNETCGRKFKDSDPVQGFATLA